MDHLPRVREPLLGSEIVVPFLVTRNHYGDFRKGYLKFAEFPARLGYNSIGLKLDGSNNLPDFAFLQSWLFFGLLAELFGDSSMQYDHQDFVNSSEQPVNIATKELERYVWFWQAKAIHEDLDLTTAHAEEVDQSLRLVHSIVHRLCEASDLSSWKSNSTTIILSIMILAEHLIRARKTIVLRSPQLELRWVFHPLDIRLAEAGWCVGDVAAINRDCSISTRYYLSTIDRLGLQRNHPHVATLGKDHRRCDVKHACCANQIEESAYPTRHTLDCSSTTHGLDDCRRVGPPISQVRSMLEDDDDYPVMIYDFNTGAVEVDSALDNRGYVAISHVWSDGLGNKEENTLQECQVRRIQALVNRLCDTHSPPAKFWVDTFGVPVGLENVNFRQRAIQRMAKIYRNADRVLVLDNFLQYCDAKCSWTEKMIRIRYSTWMTRVWTLMEGMSTRSLWIQFEGQAIASDDLMDHTVHLRGESAVSRCLSRFGTARVLGNRNAIRLVKALRQQPLATEVQSHGTVRIWDNVIQQESLSLTGLEIENSSRLRAQIQVMIFCSVVACGLEAFQRLRGCGYENYVDDTSTRTEQAVSQDWPPRILFKEVCLGLRGRTTSRREDEAECLSLLLGTDVTKIEVFAPLHWKMKAVLSLVHEHASSRVILGHSYGQISRLLNDCQERRMKRLLKQIGSFPKSMLFWDLPRIPTDGWSWAPTTFLDPAFSYDIWAQGFSPLTERGLKVVLDGFRLTKLCSNMNADAEIWSRNDILLRVHVHGDHGGDSMPRRRAWQSLRVLKGNAHMLGPKISSSDLNNMAILFDQSSSPDMTKGVLVYVHYTEADTTFARHLSLVEKISFEGVGSAGLRHVEADWCAGKTWHVG